MAKQALITGASRGIGKAIAKTLARSGYDLFLTCSLRIDLLSAYAEELEQGYHVRCIPRKVDSKDPQQVEQLFNEIPELDVLINNAGISYVGLLTEMTDEDWNTMISTNLSGVFYYSKHAAKRMLRTHSGHILNISSVWGQVGASTEAAYSASKGGVNSFTKALAKELAPSGIRVNALALGLMDTDMNRCFSEEDLALVTEEIPMGRMGSPEEAAQMVLSILESPAYLTGQVIAMDGGWI